MTDAELDNMARAIAIASECWHSAPYYLEQLKLVRDRTREACAVVVGKRSEFFADARARVQSSLHEDSTEMERLAADEYRFVISELVRCAAKIREGG